MKTLVIHPQDSSTDFLKPVYEIIQDKTIVTGNRDIKDVNKLIKSHERIMMMGHGCSNGLFSIGRFPNSKGLVICNETVPLLKEKSNSVFIWCYAEKFVHQHGLSGFYTGMFVSETAEARMFNISASQKEIDFSNSLFSRTVNKYIDDPNIAHQVKEIYRSESSAVIKYNSERIFQKERNSNNGKFYCMTYEREAS